jgi:hypothetical protein
MQHTSKEWVKVWHDPVLLGLLHPFDIFCVS